MKSYLKIDELGNKIYRNKDGKLYNENGPAVIWPDGSKFYFINDRELTPEQFKKYRLKKLLKELT